MANTTKAIPTLLELEPARIKAIEGKAGKGMRVHRVSLDGKAPQFLLHPIGAYSSIPWTPSVYGGDGTEQRLNVQIQVSDEQREAIENLEYSTREQLGIDASNWNSVVKPNAEGGVLKAKLNLSGPKATQVSGRNVAAASQYVHHNKLRLSAKSGCRPAPGSHGNGDWSAR